MSQYVTTVHGAASGLSDDERAALLRLAIDTVACHHDLDRRAAALVLDGAAETGDAYLVGDAERVAVTLHGRPLVAMTRASLREMARAA